MQKLTLRVMVFIACFWGASAGAAPFNFPALSGRVVDQANLLKPMETMQLEQMLQQFEQQTKHQLVVVTVRSLQGNPIEEYGYQLGRTWGIGQKGRDDGVLLIVAPNERKVRIEVGYGLEGTLTDAKSSRIIREDILPRFKSNEMSAGIQAGVVAIIQTLGGTVTRPLGLNNTAAETIDLNGIIVIIFLVIFLAVFLRGRARGTTIGFGSRSGSSGRKNFRGGGGGFGGGGSSGGW